EPDADSADVTRISRIESDESYRIKLVTATPIPDEHIPDLLIRVTSAESASGLMERELAHEPSHHVHRTLQRRVQRTGVLAAGFGHIGTPATRAPNFLCDFGNDFACLHACGEIFGDADDQCNLPVLHRAQHHHSGAELVAHVVHQS